MIRVLRELIYTYPDAESYLRDRAYWTERYARGRATGGPLAMVSVVIDERVIADDEVPSVTTSALHEGAPL